MIDHDLVNDRHVLASVPTHQLRAMRSEPRGVARERIVDHRFIELQRPGERLFDHGGQRLAAPGSGRLDLADQIGRQIAEKQCLAGDGHAYKANKRCAG